MTDEKKESVPTLPQYQPPVAQKPGMLGKVMSKMLKLPKGPKMPKMRTRTPRVGKMKKKQAHFY